MQMADIAIVLALVILNALGRAAFGRWRSARGRAPTARNAVQHRRAATGRRPALLYPLHPSPNLHLGAGLDAGSTR
jgi:hypothetical protein